MRVLLFVTTLVTLLLGCNSPGTFYHIKIDRAFTQDQLAEVMAGISDWESKVPVTFLIDVEPCQGFSDHGICIRAGDPLDQGGGGSDTVGISRSWWNVDGAEITMFPGYWALKQLTGHEMGHAMGLRHWGPGTDVPTTEPVIMAPEVPDGADHVTVNDIAQWYEVRGRVVPNAP